MGKLDPLLRGLHQHGRRSFLFYALQQIANGWRVIRVGKRIGCLLELVRNRFHFAWTLPNFTLLVLKVAWHSWCICGPEIHSVRTRAQIMGSTHGHNERITRVNFITVFTYDCGSIPSNNNKNLIHTLMRFCSHILMWVQVLRNQLHVRKCLMDMTKIPKVRADHFHFFSPFRPTIYATTSLLPCNGTRAANGFKRSLLLLLLRNAYFEKRVFLGVSIGGTALLVLLAPLT